MITTSTSKPPPGRLLYLFALGVVCVFASGCFDDPVEEELELRFGDEHTLEIRYRSELIDGWWDETDNESFSERMNNEERSLLEGWNSWLERLDGVEAVSDGGSWTRRERHLVSFERWVLTSEAERELGGLFAGTLVQPAMVVESETVSLSFQTYRGSRANAAETRWIEAKLDDWSLAVADYYRALDRVWRRLASEPDRAEPLLRELLDDVIESDEPAEEPNPTRPGTDDDGNDPDVERVLKAEEAVLALFEIEDDEAFTLQELSRKRLDPFPANLLVKPAGTLVEVVGFEDAGDGLLSIPRRSLWDSFEALEGRWFGPDPLVVKVAKTRNPTLRFDLKEFMDQDFVYPASPPTARDIEEALLEVARGQQEYRVVWARAPEDE